MFTSGMTRSAYEVKVQLSKLGQELELIHAKGAIDDIEQWIQANSKVTKQMGRLIGMADKTYGTEVTSSNPASPTMILMHCRVNVKQCRKSQGREGVLPLRQNRKCLKDTDDVICQGCRAKSARIRLVFLLF